MLAYSTNRNLQTEIAWNRNNPSTINRSERKQEKCRRHLREAKLTSASYNIYKQRINKWTLKQNGKWGVTYLMVKWE